MTIEERAHDLAVAFAQTLHNRLDIKPVKVQEDIDALMKPWLVDYLDAYYYFLKEIK